MRIEVYKLATTAHPSSKKLVLQAVANDKVCCLHATQWEGIEFAVHIPPNVLIDTSRPEFGWLPASDPHAPLHLVQARTMGGVESWGFMTPAPAGLKPGDDACQVLGIVEYRPENT